MILLILSQILAMLVVAVAVQLEEVMLVLDLKAEQELL